MIIDSHCHLDFDSINSQLSEILRKADLAGVKYLLSICTNDNSFLKINEIIRKFKNVYGTYGIHPHEAKNYTNLNLERIKLNLSKSDKIIGVGESGLDYYYNHSDPKFQKQLFLKHINASQDTKKTLIVHSRNAEKDMFDIISSEIKNKSFKVLMHCFTGSREFAHKLLDIGCYFSASGIITFKKNSTLADTFKSIPNDKILVETDSPYLSPEPLRGKINEPSNLIHTVKYLAKIKNETFENTSSFTTKNYLKLFSIKI